MKKLVSAVMAVIIIILMFTACKKDETPSAVKSVPSEQSSVSAESISPSNLSSEVQAAEVPAEKTEPDVSKTQSTTLAEKTAASSGRPSSAADDVNSCSPPDNFNCNTLAEFVAHINQSDATKGETDIVTAQAKKAQKLLIARSKVPGFENDVCEIRNDGWSHGTRGMYSLSFATQIGSEVMKNQRLTVYFYLLSDEEAEKDVGEVVQILTGRREQFKQGNYNGMDFYYQDYSKDENGEVKNYTNAIIKKDNCAVIIEAVWRDMYKPWSNEYFDMLDFEYVSIK